MKRTRSKKSCDTVPLTLRVCDTQKRDREENCSQSHIKILVYCIINPLYSVFEEYEPTSKPQPKPRFNTVTV
jgi:hypothetical protein